MGIKVARGAQISFHNLAVEICNYKVGGGHGRVIDPARFDHNQRLGTAAVDAGDIAKCVRSEAAAGDLLVRCQNLFAKRFEKHAVILRKAFTRRVYQVKSKRDETGLAVAGCPGITHHPRSLIPDLQAKFDFRAADATNFASIAS